MYLKIRHLTKQYAAHVTALGDFSLTVGPGVLGLVGPNGAGKSTLMRVLATITAPTSGTVIWNGEDIAQKPDALRTVLGYLPQDFGVYPHLNAIEFLNYIAALKGVPANLTRKRIEQVLDVVNLRDAAKRPLGSYSGGMRQRLGIAQALLNDPQLLIVDEPTAGLDPEERARFRALIANLSGERIVIFSTHIISDVEAAATSIALINTGRLIAHLTPGEMLAKVQGRVWNVVAPDGKSPPDCRVVSIARRADGLHLRLIADAQPAPNATLLEPTLEDAYVAMQP